MQEGGLVEKIVKGSERESREKVASSRSSTWMVGPIKVGEGEFRVVDQGHPGPPYHINLIK